MEAAEHPTSSGGASGLIRGVECVVASPSDGAQLETSAAMCELGGAFPSLVIREVATPGDDALWVDLAAWRDPHLDFWRFDGWAEEALRRGAHTLALIGTPRVDPADALQVLTRCQRLIRTRNRGSRGPQFEGILARHALLFDVSKPLVLADYRHALDTWQWTLRLQPQASTSVQIAALFHDIERLVSEPDARVEQHASDYRAFKVQHATAGGAMLRAISRDLSDPAVLEAADLVARHEVPEADGDLALLNDADALSFFSLNSSGYLDYFGRDQTLVKLRYTLARMRRSALSYLPTLRLRGDVAELLVHAAGTDRYGSAA